MKQSLLIILLLVTQAQAGWFGPSNYDECVLDGMKGVESDLAAKVIVAACRRQFPLKQKESQQTPNDEVKMLKVSKIELHTKLSGTIYNGTGDWVVTEITIRAITTGVTKLHNVTKTIPPLTASTFFINYPSTIKPHFVDVLSARGYKK